MTSGVLVVALAHAAVKRPAVGVVGARIVLHVARPAQRRRLADERVAVHRERPLAVRGLEHRRRRPAERAREHLYVGAAGGTAGGAVTCACAGGGRAVCWEGGGQ